MSDRPSPPPAPARSIDLIAAGRALDEFLRALGHDEHTNPELAGTGARVAEAFAHEFCAGEGSDLDALLRPHVMPAPTTGEKLRASPARVLLKDLPLITMCPHHLLPAEGTAHVAYEPADHIVGIGAVAALIERAGRRLVLQEKLADDVVGALVRVLAPKWLLVRTCLKHSCMRLRGERAHGSAVETWSQHGEVPEAMHALLAGASR